MACDIHAHVEVQIDGQWEHYSVLNVPRNYALFTKLCGVRQVEGVEPIGPPRGIPHDITKMTKFNLELWKDDSHSHSWIDGKQAQEVEDWFNETQKARVHPAEPWGYLFGNSFGTPETRDPRMQNRVGDVRIVFWFDN